MLDAQRLCSLCVSNVFLLLSDDKYAAYQCLDCEGVKPTFFGFRGPCKRCDGSGRVFGCWNWSEPSTNVTLAREGLVATKMGPENKTAFVFGGLSVTSGHQYWEVLLTSNDRLSQPSPRRVRRLGRLLIGCVRKGQLDSDRSSWATAAAFSGPGGANDEACFLFGNNGALYGNGRRGEGGVTPSLASNDRVGVLVDLDSGTLKMYRNGYRYGPSFESGVAGPLVFCVDMLSPGMAATVVPDAVEPAAH